MKEALNSTNKAQADLILTGGKITAGSERYRFAESLAIKDGKFLAVGGEREILPFKGAATKIINLNGRTVIPGLSDSHMHPIRGGLNYNLELRWDGVDSLADALSMLKVQAQNTPPPQWVRVVGGWSEFQFKERRMPTLREINEAAPDTPVFVLHLYDRTFLNGAALRAIGYDRNTPDPPGGFIERDKQGNPTGLLIAKPNAMILYSTLARGPKLSAEDQRNSSRQFMRELNRLGITSVIDAGGGFQNYPEDYLPVEQLHKDGLCTVRFAYNLFTQRPGAEYEDFAKWTQMTSQGAGDAMYKMNGAGEMLVFSAADFEDFLEPRPDLAASMEDELFRVVSLLAENRWAFRLHATYDESIERVLNVYERVHREVAPIDDLRWFIDHAETISDKNIERVKNLGGGIAIQHRMAFQGECFLERYGAAKIRRAPVGAGTDATRVASYNPFVSLYWLVSGKTVGGLEMYDETNRLSRDEALRLWTTGSSWFSGDASKKGVIAAGQYADLAVLSADYFKIPEEEIKSLSSVLTIVGGKIVYAAEEFSPHSPPALPVSPDWSPVKTFGGYQHKAEANLHRAAHVHGAHCADNIFRQANRKSNRGFGLFGGDFSPCACAF